MRIGIDASRYGHATATGIEWYSYHILNQLIPRFGREHNHEFTLYLREETSFAEEFPFNVSKKVIPYKKFWTLLRLSWEMIKHPVDVLFVPSHIPPLMMPRKTIVTIHDLAFMDKRLKRIYSWQERLLLKWSTRRSVRKAWRILVPSKATADDLERFFRCKPEKIVVIPHGAPDLTGDENPLLKKWTKTDEKMMLDRLGLDEKQLFALYVGRLELKKNLVRLVEAFKRFRGEYPDWKLVLAGKRGIGYELIWEKILELGLENDVVMPGYVAEEEKQFLLSRCRMYVFPSLYEGFGLPILEAFAYRRPVLTSQVTAMPEVGGKGCFYVNPEEVAEISVGMKRLASDGVLVSHLIAAGEKQLEKFSWDRAGEKTYEVLALALE